MREIKFRAWDGKGKIMMEPSMNMLIDSSYGTPMWSFAYDPLIPQIDWEVMQYTGLKDKNGKEIYEGDIVNTKVNKHWWIFVIEPVKSAPNGQLYAIEKLSNCTIDTDDELYTFKETKENSGRRKELLSGNDFEVIGNIYENPELLEG